MFFTRGCRIAHALLFALLFTFVVVGPLTVQAQLSGDRLGSLEVSDIFLEPSFQYQETRQGRFEAGNSFVAFRWLRDDAISAEVMAGTRELVSRPRRYISGTEGEFTLAEGYVQARSTLGTFRFGRVPLPYGIESGRAEALLRFPRSMFFRQSWLGLRDQGISYAVENNGFFSEWAVHNGEGGPDLDNQMWFTARWGWKGSDGIYGGASGAAGRTTPASTQTPTSARTTADAGLDPDQSAKIRFGNLFFEWDGYPFGVVLEGNFGETEQSKQVTVFRSGHFDLNYTIARKFALLARYDLLDPSDRTKNDQEEETSVGFSWRGLYGTSTLYVFGTRRHVQSQPQESHEGMVLWRLTPLARGPR